MSTSSNSTAHIVPLASQVGGHPGVETTEDGSLLIKPALAREVRFYQTLSSDSTFAALRPFVPKFLGTLKLHGSTEPQQQTPLAAAAVAGDDSGDVSAITQMVEDGLREDQDSIVLENLSHLFAKPNILDIKLGTVLYDEGASPEKRARMEKAAQATTSFETGVRLTGFQVYDSATEKFNHIDKAYGRSIKASDLPDGIARFFPLPSDSPTKGQDEEEIPTTTTGTGLPKDLLLPILKAIKSNITQIQGVLQTIEMRMVGASLLIIYEADVEHAKEGLATLAERAGFSAEEIVEEEDVDDYDDDEDDDDDDDDDDDGKVKKVGAPFVVKLIDFAHTSVALGQGPDQGVLLGVSTVLQLLDRRIAQISGAT